MPIRLLLGLVIAGLLFTIVPAAADDWVAAKLRGRVLQLVGAEWQPLARGDVVSDDRVIRTLASGRVDFERGAEVISMGGRHRDPHPRPRRPALHHGGAAFRPGDDRGRGPQRQALRGRDPVPRGRGQGHPLRRPRQQDLGQRRGAARAGRGGEPRHRVRRRVVSAGQTATVDPARELRSQRQGRAAAGHRRRRPGRRGRCRRLAAQAGNPGNATDGLRTTVGKVTNALGETVGGVAQGLGNTVGGVTQGVGHTVGGVVQGVGNTVGAVTGAVLPSGGNSGPSGNGGNSGTRRKQRLQRQQRAWRRDRLRGRRASHRPRRRAAALRENIPAAAVHRCGAILPRLDKW